MELSGEGGEAQGTGDMVLPLLYSAVAVALGGAVLRLLLRQELESGLAAALRLLLALFSQPLCSMAMPGYPGLCLFSLACLLAYSRLPVPQLLPVQGKAILITGCDSGFGHALAKYLDKLGFTVFAGVLYLDGPGAQDLKMCGSDRLTVLQLDVTSSEQIAETFEHVKAQLKNRGLWGIVNNAGVLEFVADAELLPMNIFKHCMAVNFFGAVEVTKIFLPLLRQAKGRLVNVTSVAGVTPLLGFAGYGASKAALNMFSNILRSEIAIWGVKVAIIQPTSFRTGIFGTSDQWSNQHKKLMQYLSPDVRKDYGESYITSCIDNRAKYHDESREDLQTVLDDISLALMAKNPKRVYSPGQAALYLPFLHQYAPTCIFEYVMISLVGSGLNQPDGVKEKGSHQ
ncbi:17-beta-hydroxysteroid dehydrogenase type 2 isoform X1 [Amblyraja radiata]|uniref:17-beta-hydroxysteroid dehydrogenase type 2 isoform X1 n=1 Tax=Amblyraja radiata TaxID=386614 RepID=UPI00140200EF|nr:17-beta-hydroxysteroid dehydrogenase type 2 isoform X1 [Amblyraja radiata]